MTGDLKKLTFFDIFLKLWYSSFMNRDTLKELGKFGLDISKIIFAIAILTPLTKDASINIYAILGSLSFAIGGIVLINRSGKDE